jgi:hypothetical protein
MKAKKKIMINKVNDIKMGNYSSTILKQRTKKQN